VLRHPLKEDKTFRKFKGTESIARNFRTLKIPMPLVYKEFFPFLCTLLQHSPVTPILSQKYIYNLIVTISILNKETPKSMQL
jgi:hypothetical protein